jgi:peptide/nickel transport system substrate-binding protein
MKTTRILAALAAAGVAASLAACSGAGGGTAGQAAQHSDTLAVGTMTVAQSLDPTQATGSALPYYQAVYDTLVLRKADGTFAPMLATEWTYDSTGTKLTLTLRSGVTFSDGTAFDATAVKKNLEAFAQGGGGSATQLASLKTVQVVDPTHVVLELKQPDPALLFSLSDAAGLMASPAKIGSKDLATQPDGTGPYTLDTGKTAIGSKYVYERKADYWGDEAPYKTLSISSFDNENAIVNGLKTGQLNTAVLQTVDQQIAAEGDTKLTEQKFEFDFQGILLFDRVGAVNKALADPRVRQAVNYGIDRAALLQGLRQGRGTVTSQIWGTDTPGYDKALDAAYPYDPAKAKQLLADAGYAKGVTLTLPAMAGITTDAMTSALTTQLAKAGITVKWDQLDGATALQKIFRDRAYAGMVMNLGQSSNAWNLVQTAILPGTFNPFGYTDDTVKSLSAKLLTDDDAATATDAAALNKHVVEDAWFAPFYRMTYTLVTDPTVKATTQSGMAVPSIYDYQPAS